MHGIRQLDRGVIELEKHLPVIQNYKNFRGDKFQREGGNKTFSVVLEDEEMADELERLGWALKAGKFEKKEDEFGYYYVGYKSDYQPMVEDKNLDLVGMRYIDIHISEKFPKIFKRIDAETGNEVYLNPDTVVGLQNNIVYYYIGCLAPSSWTDGKGPHFRVYGGSGDFLVWGGKYDYSLNDISGPEDESIADVF